MGYKGSVHAVHVRYLTRPNAGGLELDRVGQWGILAWAALNFWPMGRRNRRQEPLKSAANSPSHSLK